MSTGDSAHAALVLVVEDDRQLARLLDGQLREHGFRTTLAATGKEALERAQRQRPDLMLLDLNLPDIAGADVCRQVKAAVETAHVRVLMLTGRATEEDRVAGFEAGADDYVCKPFSLRELILRIHALDRRDAGARTTSDAIRRCGPITIDPAAYSVAVDERPVVVSKTELRLLVLLSEQAGRVYSYAELSYGLWQALEDPQVTRLQTHVRRLKAKLGAAAGHVELVGTVGYRLRAS
jgi:two-component system, OmpR family, phosphate regulon response regulator PhoB